MSDTQMPIGDTRLAVLSPSQGVIIDAILAGMSLQDAAKAGGYSQRTVLRWLKGETDFKRELVRRYKDKRLIKRALRQVLRDPKTPPSTRVSAAAMLDNLGCVTFDDSGRPIPVLSPSEVNRVLRRRVHERVSGYLLERPAPRVIPAPDDGAKPDPSHARGADRPA